MYSIALKSVALSWLCIQEWFCNITHWSFEKIGSLSYADLSNMDTFHCTRSKKSHLFILPPITSRSLSSVGKQSCSLWQAQVFQNWLATDTINCFLWHDKLFWVILCKFLSDTQVSIIVPCQLFQEKMVLHTHTHTQSASSARYSVTQELCLQTTITF